MQLSNYEMHSEFYEQIFLYLFVYDSVSRMFSPMTSRQPRAQFQ